MLAINTLGVLYIVESGDTVHSVEDLRGKTIYASGKGNTPEAALNYVLTQNGIDLASDVTIEWKSEQAECLSALMAGGERHCHAASALSSPPPRPRAKTSVWRWIWTEDGTRSKRRATPSTLVTGVVVGRTVFVAEHPEAVSAFLEHYRASVEYVNANVDEAAQLVGSMRSSPQKWHRRPCRSAILFFIEGAEMKDSLSGYLSVLFEQNSQVCGRRPAR